MKFQPKSQQEFLGTDKLVQIYTEVQKVKNNQGSPEDEEQVGREWLALSGRATY